MAEKSAKPCKLHLKQTFTIPTFLFDVAKEHREHDALWVWTSEAIDHERQMCSICECMVCWPVLHIKHIWNCNEHAYALCIIHWHSPLKSHKDACIISNYIVLQDRITAMSKILTQSSLYKNDIWLPALLEPYNFFYNFYAYYKIAFIAVLLCFWHMTAFWVFLS